MDNFLSIIIPCFNSAGTLVAAVESIFAQKNLDVDFEVIMVDDGSTDTTKEIIQALEKKYPQIHSFFHSENRGGGAARNTAVKHSVGEIIFCLDSDDLLHPEMLGNMVRYWREKKCDGLSVSTVIKFNKNSLCDVERVVSMDYIGEVIPFESLLSSGECGLYSTFFHTRKSFDIIGGYPENHGFDTQCFAFRFLANGLTAYTCPETAYYQRVHYHKSYCIREYEAGNASHNWCAIFDEFFYLFSDEAKKILLTYDLNDSTYILFDKIKSLENVFSPNYKNFLSPCGSSDYCRVAEKDALYYYFVGMEQSRFQNYKESILLFLQSIELGNTEIRCFDKFFSCSANLAGISYEHVRQGIKNEHTHTYIGSRSTFLKKIARRIKKYRKIISQAIDNQSSHKV